MKDQEELEPGDIITVNIEKQFIDELMLNGESPKMMGKYVPMYSVCNIDNVSSVFSTGKFNFSGSSEASIVGIETKKVFENGQHKRGAQ